MRTWLARIGAACVAAVLLAAAPAGAAEAPTITAKPGLKPGFRPHISDYTTHCREGEPLTLAIAAPEGTTVAVDGAPPRTGVFAASVPLAPGQAADLVVRSGESKRRHHVRCLPADFPAWTFKRWRRPAAQWYLIAPVGGLGTPNPRSNYLTFVDGRGVPVWWLRRNIIPFNTILLPSGEIAWARWGGEPFGRKSFTGWEVHELSGRLVRGLTTIGSPTDLHDMQPLPNGNYMLLTYRLRRHVDTRLYKKGLEDGAVWDGELQELTPAGKRVWSWNSKDHMKLAENRNWRFAWHDPDDGGVRAHDWFHLNSVEPDGDGYIISARHLDAVYRIDRATGNVTWKLGGTKTSKSLTPKGHPVQGPFVGQHDARLLADGTLTVYDNHVALDDPRAVRYRIDAAKRTATLLEDIREPSLEYSAAEGSARRLPGGHWVVSWGATDLISELTRSSAKVWQLRLKQAQNYRVQPIEYGRLRPHQLRRAMDLMNPRP